MYLKIPSLVDCPKDPLAIPPQLHLIELVRSSCSFVWLRKLYKNDHMTNNVENFLNGEFFSNNVYVNKCSIIFYNEIFLVDRRNNSCQFTKESTHISGKVEVQTPITVSD